MNKREYWIEVLKRKSDNLENLTLSPDDCEEILELLKKDMFKKYCPKHRLMINKGDKECADCFSPCPAANE